jgi:hypothetical protein
MAKKEKGTKPEGTKRFEVRELMINLKFKREYNGHCDDSTFFLIFEDGEMCLIQPKAKSGVAKQLRSLKKKVHSLNKEAYSGGSAAALLRGLRLPPATPTRRRPRKK